MLNLSDKELDRLARQAANEYDPGDLASPGHWDKLVSGLNKELGKPRLNPFRVIRRISFYYAPAILLLAGVSYFFVRQGKNHSRPHEPTPASPLTARTESSGGSPPLAVIKPIPPGQAPNEQSANTKNYSDKSTSTPEKETGKDNSSAADGHTAIGAVTHNHPPGSGRDLAHTGNPGSAGHVETTGERSAPIAPAGIIAPAGTIAPGTHRPGAYRPGSTGSAANRPGTNNPGANKPGVNKPNANQPNANTADPNTTNSITAGIPTSQAGIHAPGVVNSSGVGNDHNPAPTHIPAPPKEPALSVVQGPLSLTRPPVVDDSGLRGFSAAVAAKVVGPITLGKSKGPSLRIDRPLQFGFTLAPDFSSVNSLAGDKPGSSIGITIDYQFANRLYLSTGLLFSRKNYTATTDDYHVPYNYYAMNNMHDVNYVKGSFHFLEIPLNLRYDFSIAGNTTFFATGGLSSYLLTNENCNYYYNLFGREASRGFNYQGNGTHLFSAVNLSLGVETGLTNDLSLLIAPYVKVPTSGIGFGRVEMNSLGINFALKYSPVLKRTRHR